MIIIQLAGGLGNQMFQYALYLQLKSLGKDVKVDDVTGFAQDDKRNPALSPFGISYERVSRKELERMLDSSPLPWNKVRRRLCGRKKKSYFEEDKKYHHEIMTWDDIYLEGYWQTEKYFAKISDEIKKILDTDKLLEYLGNNGLADNPVKSASAALFDKKVSDRLTMDDWLERITSTESVSVHIRRGDYLLPENRTLFGNICTAAYYRNAMDEMKQQYPDCRFYLFTNDKEWIKERIDECIRTGAAAKDPQTGGVKPAYADSYCDTENIEVVDLGEEDDYAEFVLMSKCKHNILANSSFSWWASYLNKNPNKTVLAPGRWLNGWDCEDYYRKDMRKVNAG